MKLHNLIESFFVDRLGQQMRASPHTVASYIDTFHLLFKYAKEKLKKTPKELMIGDLNVKFIINFLNDMETRRKISVRTRNQRLAAIRSFFRYCSYQLPESSTLIAEVLSIPEKRTEKRLIDFLSQEEVKAILEAPNQQEWGGKRDYTFLTIAIQTGMRLGELTSLQWKDVSLEHHPYIKCLGKGRKERSTPLSSETVKCLLNWFRALNPLPTDFVFPTIHGQKMSADTVQLMLKKHAKKAVEHCKSISGKRITPHMLRHTTAMRLIEMGVDIASIALLLGHESIKTTYVYLKADMAMKEKILSKLPGSKVKTLRYKPDDNLRTFLKNLSV
jgi:integrase/recombinase XerD